MKSMVGVHNSLQEIQSHVFTVGMLLQRGISARSVSRLVQQRKLYALRKGVYIEMPFWESLKNYERYRAHIIAYNLIADHPVFSHQTAAIIQGLSVPQVPGFLHVYVRPGANGPASLVKKHHLLSEETSVETHFSIFRTTGIERTLHDCSTPLSISESVAIVDSALNQRKVHFHQASEFLENA